VLFQLTPSWPGVFVSATATPGPLPKICVLKRG
jgi:hypothetical protein